MTYFAIAATAFFTDFCIKAHIDKKYVLGARHPHLQSRIILEKYYNNGAALNFLAQKPKIMRLLHTAALIVVGVFSYFYSRTAGKPLVKTGLALLLGGGCSNLYDRYAKGHVVDYFRINLGPKWLRRIIFNISDFCIFIGALLTAIPGADEAS